MNHETRVPERLTAEQSNRVLDLAARLQAAHDGTIAVVDLERVAAEAGIDPGFVREAARSLALAPQPLPSPLPSPERAVAFALIGLLAVANAAITFTPLREAILSSAGGLGLLTLAALSGFWAVKGRLSAFLSPLAIVATLIGTQSAYVILRGKGYDALNSNVAQFVMIQVAFAFVATLVGLVTFRLRVRRVI